MVEEGTVYGKYMVEENVENVCSSCERQKQSDGIDYYTIHQGQDIYFLLMLMYIH